MQWGRQSSLLPRKRPVTCPIGQQIAHHWFETRPASEASRPRKRHDGFTWRLRSPHSLPWRSALSFAPTGVMGKLSLRSGDIMLLIVRRFFIQPAKRRSFASLFLLDRTLAPCVSAAVSPLGLNTVHARGHAVGHLAPSVDKAMIGSNPAMGLRRPPPFNAVRT